MPIIKVHSPHADYDLPDADSIKQRIGQRIREQRLLLRMSQEELAKNVGKKTATYIALIEKGTRNISAVDLARIAHHFKIDLSFFYP